MVAFLGWGGGGWSDGTKVCPFFLANLHWVVEISITSVEPFDNCNVSLPSGWYFSSVALYQPVGSSVQRT